MRMVPLNMLEKHLVLFVRHLNQAIAQHTWCHKLRFEETSQHLTYAGERSPAIASAYRFQGNPLNAFSSASLIVSQLTKSSCSFASDMERMCRCAWLPGAKHFPLHRSIRMLFFWTRNLQQVPVFQLTLHLRLGWYPCLAKQALIAAAHGII